MEGPAQTLVWPPRRGTARLKAHCDLIEQMIDLEREPSSERIDARARLEAELGSDLARVLIATVSPARRDSGARSKRDS